MRLVKNEIAKLAAGGNCVSVLDQLNDGGKKAIGDANNDAYSDTAGTAGQVYITGLDASDCPVSGTPVVIGATKVAGTADGDYPTDRVPGADTKDFTPE